MWFSDRNTPPRIVIIHVCCFQTAITLRPDNVGGREEASSRGVEGGGLLRQLQGHTVGPHLKYLRCSQYTLFGLDFANITVC